MKILKPIWLLSFLLAVLLAGCGGGGGSNSNGILTLQVGNQVADAGKPLTVTAQFALEGRTTGLNGLKITIYSPDYPEMINRTTLTTDLSGYATGVVTTNNITTNQVQLTLLAKIGDVISSPVSVTLNPATLTFTPPGDGTFTVAAASAGGVLRVVNGGSQVTIRDGASGSPFQNQEVTISVQTIVNQRNGDQVVFFPVPGTEVIAPPGVIILTTDSNGTVILPIAVDMVSASPGASHVINVIWKITAETDGGTLVGYGSTLYTVTTDPPEA